MTTDDDPAMPFRDRLLARRPDLVARRAANAEKRALALALIACRWKAVLSQEEVAASAGLGFATVRRLESLAGAMPADEDVARYRSACGEQGLR